PWKRHQALQALADSWGHPFGFVACWPVQRHSAAQIEKMTALYLDYWHLAKAAGRHRAKAADTRGALWYVLVGQSLLSPGSLDPGGAPENAGRRIAKQPFVRRLSAQAEVALGQTAELLNQTPGGYPLLACEQKVRRLFGELAQDALLLGLEV